MHDPAAVIDVALRVWLPLTALSTIYVAIDAVRRNPEMKVMKWGWVLVTLYTGPIGGVLYVLSCQEPSPGIHEQFVTPLWKQSLGSTIHCLAGDATGIIAAAVVTMALRLNMATDLAVEYAFGFAFGLLVFQALFMRDMVGGSYAKSLRMSLLPEWISMNAVMGGMIPVMGILMTRHMSAMEPASLRFWGVMSLATIVGAIVAYPFNVWLVAAKLKHGMGTVRALGEGGHRVEAGDARPGDRVNAMPPMAMNHASMGAQSMSHGQGSPVAMPDAAAAREPGPPPMSMKPAATLPQIAAVTLLSVLILAAGVVLGTLYGELTMRGEMPGHASAPRAPVTQSPAL